jgi:Zn-dependent protease
MSEPTISFPTPLERAQSSEPKVWLIPRPRQRWPLYVLFFVLTMSSTMVVGARMMFYFQRQQSIFGLNDETLPFFPIDWVRHHPHNLLMGLPFSLTLMFILFAHEMGHYLYCRHYRVYATPPFFVPFPSLIGTLGAFIRIKSPIPSRAALFDIGIAGPIAGFIPSCIALLYGLSISQPTVPFHAADTRAGFPLAFYLGAKLLHIGLPLAVLSLHPIAAAAWVGMFATSLNLLPGGQLDGGHIVFSISPRWHRWISLATVMVMLPLGKYLWTGWFLWAVLLSLTLRHPRVPKCPDVSGWRRPIALCAALMLVLTFTPAPFTNSSGRDVWQELGPGILQESRDALHYLRNETCRLLPCK